ncbi:MAG: hypothetical protein H7210_09660 [Pyrinomonadaceae bacterium]|nr:hypothetical protein [Phycisphaerales bacterium]
MTTTRFAARCPQAPHGPALNGSSPNVHRTCRAVLAGAFLFAGATLVGCSSGSEPSDVAGRYILSISDADMPATAIFDGALSPGAGTDAVGQDSLTTIALPIADKKDAEYVTAYAQILGVSNSVIGPPQAVAVTRDGMRAYVVESRGPAPAGATTTDELPIGRKLTAINLSDPMKPVVIGTVDVGPEPMGVDVDPSGEVVAVVTTQDRQQLVLVTAHSGGMGEPLPFPIMGLDTDDNVMATSVQWHPSGKYLAVTLAMRNQVAFFKFTRDPDGSMALAPWGAPVAVGRFPYSGRFTPDGTFYIAANMEWDMNIERSFIQSPAGHLSVVRFDAEGAPGNVGGSSSAKHELVSTAPVGVNPEGLAISPDGSLVVTSNFQRTFLPEDDARVTRDGSLSLLKLNSRSGELTPVGEYPISGMPAGLSFDAKGGFVVVTQFRSFDARAVDGMLVFWKVRGGGAPSLEKAKFTVGVGKGPHGVLIIR